MRIQALAVIAIIIILPMTILLNEYSKNQIKTLQLQIQYDSKLDNATYDAIKTFQMNMTNSDTSDLADSKMRDIKASINVFFNSLSSNFNMSGYGKEVLQNYVPAVVYTLYDGYYIYSDYKNTLDEQDKFVTNASYSNDTDIYGLKPYIYYSCRYKKDDIDVTITYSLDSYITIQGKINNTSVNESGYLLTGVTKSEDKYYYKGIEIIPEIDKEGLKQNVFIESESEENKDPTGNILNFPCKKINGVKYYKESSTNKVFAVINGKKYEQTNVNKIEENRNGIQFYKDAYEFKEKFKTGDLQVLKSLSSSYAVDSDGRYYKDKYLEDNNPYSGDYKIFGDLDSSSKFIEDENSSFNTHRLQVIKNSIESNLVPAISNYNKVSTSSVNFQMPKLSEVEWEQITNNISMITFLQGLNIGGKIYNGYSIISNNNNEDFVSEDSIYILNNGEYHRVTDEDIGTINNQTIGIYNNDFQRRMSDIGEGDNAKTFYYFPRNELACYNSIVNANSDSNKQSISEYLAKTGNEELAQIYYTALGRERYGLYRVTNKLEEVQEVMNQGFR